MIAVGGWSWILGYTHKGKPYLFGLSELNATNLTAIELGRRVADALEV